MEALLLQCEKDLKKLRSFEKEFKTIEANRKALEKYYSTSYLKDYEKHQKNPENIRVLDQDSIWNVLSNQYNEKIKLLKVVMKSI